MAGELKTSYITGQTVYFLLRNNTGQVWNGSAFEAYVAGNFATYDIAASEQGTSGFYVGTMPAAIAGTYNVEARVQAGGSPAQSDLSLGSGPIEWNGTVESYLFGNTKLAATGLDSITVSDPTTVATTFAQMVVQIWRRFFKRVTLTSTQLICYRDDNSTAETTQTVSDNGVTQVQGPAS